MDGSESYFGIIDRRYGLINIYILMWLIRKALGTWQTVPQHFRDLL